MRVAVFKVCIIYIYIYKVPNYLRCYLFSLLFPIIIAIKPEIYKSTILVYTFRSLGMCCIYIYKCIYLIFYILVYKIVAFPDMPPPPPICTQFLTTS